MKSNVCNNIALRDCTGCGICASICGKKAITIKMNHEGFYKPVIDEDKCIECGACLKSCYKYDDNFVLSDDVLACYAAINKNTNQLKSSSSGGISRLLMEECINRGYKVLGCTYDINENIAKSIIASKIEELDMFYGSKYFQSYTVDAFEEILKDNSNQKYAIFGTPCQIYGFSKTRKYQRSIEKYLLIDIFCHGCPSYNLWNTYNKHMSSTLGMSKLKSINFRSKTYGWHEYSIDFCSETKRVTSSKYNDPFFNLFFGADIMNMACYNCKARSSMAYSDIRIGDFWGTKYELNSTGVSAVLIKSEIGQLFFNAIKDKMIIEEAEFSKIIKAQSYGKCYKFNKNRRLFLLENLKSISNIDSINKKYNKMLPLKLRIRKKLKSTIKILPKEIYFPIKKILHLMK